MKTGTTSFGHQPRNERSRTDLPHERTKHPTELTEEQWPIHHTLLPEPAVRGAPQTVCLRAIIDGGLRGVELFLWRGTDAIPGLRYINLWSLLDPIPGSHYVNLSLSWGE
jgi:hypothetical protein